MTMKEIHIKRLIDQLNRIEEKIDRLLPAEEPTEWHSIKRIEHYISNSGNPTWKAFTDDGAIIYLRQAHRDMLIDCGLWDVLNQMTLEDALYPDGLDIGTIPDGDFKKPIQIEGIIPTLEPEPEPERAAVDTLKLRVIDRLSQVIMSGDFIVLDTETTDLNGYPVQIGILSPTGDTRLDALVKPPFPISPQAARIHGITNEMVNDAGALPELVHLESHIRSAKYIIGWNVLFDRDVLLRAAEHYSLDGLADAIQKAQWRDVMTPFAAVYGEWSDYHQSYKWQKLTTAARHYGISTDGAHGAIGDCRMTLEVVKHMTETTNDAPF